MVDCYREQFEKLWKTFDVHPFAKKRADQNQKPTSRSGVTAIVRREKHEEEGSDEIEWG